MNFFLPLSAHDAREICFCISKMLTCVAKSNNINVNPFPNTYNNVFFLNTLLTSSQKNYICTSSTLTRSFRSPASNCCKISSILCILIGIETVASLACNNNYNHLFISINCEHAITFAFFLFRVLVFIQP